jgi:hypothetical protein
LRLAQLLQISSLDVIHEHIHAIELPIGKNLIDMRKGGMLQTLEDFGFRSQVTAVVSLCFADLFQRVEFVATLRKAHQIDCTKTASA